jgi:hypothetical protein
MVILASAGLNAGHFPCHARNSTIANKSERNLSGHPIFYHEKIYWREILATDYIVCVTAVTTDRRCKVLPGTGLFAYDQEKVSRAVDF